MIIKSLHLQNIRSYKEQYFYFKEGMTLLSGDIGSGKSSVLLAIEFALFGLIRGSITGTSLLRHGSKEGSIILRFLIDKEEYEIERGLKKTSTGITQDKCSLTTNGNREQLTPIELKSKVLNLLGYPEDLVSKSKTLIFRYTVYTPQEEMKQILFESKDERLEKLRKIFGVDKYELIKNNASNYAREIRAELRQYDQIKEQNESLIEKIKNLKTELNLLYEYRESQEKNLKKFLEEEQKIKQENKDLDETIQKFNEKKSLKNITVNEINSLTKNLNELEEEITKTNKSILIKEKETEKLPEIKKSSEQIKKESQEIKEKQKEIIEKINKAKNKEAIIKNKIKEINALLNNINELETCPTCKQEVTKTHKESLKNQETNKIKLYEEKLEKLKEFFEKANNNKEKIEKKIKENEKEFDDTKNLEFKQKIIKQAQKYIQESKEKIEQQKTKRQKTQEEIKNKKQKLEKIKQELETYHDIENKIKDLKEKQEKINLEIRKEEQKISATNQSIKEKDRNIKEKQEEQMNKEKEINILKNKKILENWLSNHFTNLMGIIEKQVLAKLHREFNLLFKEWFSMLIEDTELEANIEQDFSPSIIQNGYDSSIENLSGGEKTAISLAYRLALNKVINNLVHEVKTKGLLILDEPTDGFSSEQLDKVRDVLEKTNTKQLIIVSHEAKLESFVQNIIRINKNNHESEIMQI